jgi:3-phenylpropionate/trans-cinnamate dioxygenase ferredoxin reductase subunit
MPERVVIVGAGQAGAQVAISLRQLGFAGAVALLGEEPEPPYQRPPLSKALLKGAMAVERTHLRSAGFWAKAGIELRLGARVSEIRRNERTVVCADGTHLRYDALVLCTGSRARRLPIQGEQLPGVFYLRTLADCARIRAAAAIAEKAVVIGGGYIGLEVAASLRQLGCAVTVLEALERVLNRVVAPPVSGFFAAEHARQGVEIVTGAQVAALEGETACERAVTTGGRAFAADLVVIGIGGAPDDRLARAAGLAVANGVVVDDVGRTSDPAIFAAGDVTDHPNALFGRRLRLESVHNAMAQAKAVAAAILGKPEAYAEVPWFWSDQYDLKLQIAGVSDSEVAHVLRGDPATRSFSCLHLKGERLVAIDAINRPGDFLAAKALIRDRTPLDLARVQNIESPLRPG